VPACHCVKCRVQLFYLSCKITFSIEQRISNIDALKYISGLDVDLFRRLSISICARVRKKLVICSGKYVFFSSEIRCLDRVQGSKHSAMGTGGNL